jgi:hypothetical protein
LFFRYLYFFFVLSAHPLFESAARVLIEVVTRVNVRVHVLDERVGGPDAPGGVAHTAALVSRSRGSGIVAVVAETSNLSGRFDRFWHAL